MKSSPQPSDPGPPEKVRLKVGWERFSDIAYEIRYLVTRQNAEVGKHYLPFAPDWDRYLAFERAGSLSIWTARTIPLDAKEKGALVGYVVWILLRGLHSAETVFADADLVYLAPEWRDGLTGYKLLKSGIAAVKPHAEMIRAETNDLYEGGRMGVLLKRLGFERIGSVYVQRNRQ